MVQSLTRGGTAARPLLGLRTGGCCSRVSARCVSTRVGSNPRPRVPRSRHLAASAKVSPRQSTHGRAGSHGRYPCRCLSGTTVVKRHDRSTASPARPVRERERSAAPLLGYSHPGRPAGARGSSTSRCLALRVCSANAPCGRVPLRRHRRDGSSRGGSDQAEGLTRDLPTGRLRCAQQPTSGSRRTGGQAGEGGRTRQVTAAPRWQLSVHRKAVNGQACITLRRGERQQVRPQARGPVVVNRHERQGTPQACHQLRQRRGGHGAQVAGGAGR